jgi:D-alanyl-D-alanine carboxypeptidase
LHPEELVSFVLDTPPLFAAGKDWSYTDTGYLLLGLVIEKATGQSWYDEVDHRFLKPLNLFRTSPSNKVSLPELAAGYMSVDNPFGLPPKTTSDPGIMVWNPGVESSGGGFVSNSSDLAKWGKALYEGEAMQVEYLGDLLEAVPVGGDGSQVRYGAAVAIHTGGAFGPTYGHSGWIPGYCSSLRYYPDLGVAVAFQINTDTGIVDGSTQVMENMEKRLVEVLAAPAKQ